MHHVWRLLLVLLVSSAVMVTLVPSASADRVIRADAREDVAAFVADSDEPINKPGQLDPDVVRTLLAHRAQAVVIRLRFRDLTPHKQRWLMTVVKTPRDDFSITIRWRRNGSSVVAIEHDSPDAGVCPNMVRRVNVARNVILVRIPRACLGSPRWVRVGMHIQRFVPSTFTFLADDPLRDGTVHFPQSSSRLYRG